MRPSAEQLAEGHVVAFVEWMDAGIVATRWTDRQEVVTDRLMTVQGLIRTSGFLVSDDDTGVVLALSINRNNDDVNLAMFIPRAGIVTMQTWVADAWIPLEPECPKPADAPRPSTCSS